MRWLITVVIAPVTLHPHTTVSGEGQKGGYVIIAGKLNLFVNKLMGNSLRKATSKKQNIVLFVQLTWEDHRSMCLFLSLNTPSGIALWRVAITLP